VCRAQSWGQRFAIVRYLTRLSLTEREREVRGGRPSHGGGPSLEADLVIADRAASEVRVALGVSSWNGGRRPGSGVWDPCVDWGSGSPRGSSG